MNKGLDPELVEATRPASSRRLIPLPPSAPLAERAQAQEREIEKLHLLLATARELGTESSLDLLMTRLVQRTSRIMDCERSSVFLLDRARNELFTLVAQGLDSRELRIPITSGLAGHVARTGRPLNVPDAYRDERFNPEVDRRTGFRTRSVLALPLPDRRGEILGVLQCLNKHGPGPGEVPASFDATDEAFLEALASLAAVFLENAKLYREKDRLFASVVSAISRSIDDRDPCTSGHSRRVTRYALNLARAVHDCPDPPFAEIRYSRERLRQLRYAGLLHDVGKIGVREYILCKADKLPPGGLELIRARLERLEARRRAEVLERALDEKRDPAPLLAELHAPLAERIEQALALLAAKNKPGIVNDEELAALQALRTRGWITGKELEMLAVRKGNLTAAEWVDMRSHVTKSYEILQRIPWPRELGALPEVAYTHHEKRDGSGYPRGLKGDAIHFDGQVMCVADIYDALTASDRPYRKALPHALARKILEEEEARPRKLLPELVALFFEKECFKLDPEPPRPDAGRP